LHALLPVNNDRVKWYEGAIETADVTETALPDLFLQFIEESRFKCQRTGSENEIIGKRRWN
jgi:hypothetical protein